MTHNDPSKTGPKKRPQLQAAEQRLRSLIARHCDSELSESELAELTDNLLANPEARDQFLEEVGVHAWLELEIPALEEVSDHVRFSLADSTPKLSNNKSEAKDAGQLGRLVWVRSAAAGILFAAMAAFSLVWISPFGVIADPSQEFPAEELRAPAERGAERGLVHDLLPHHDATQVVAQATPIEEGCVWRFDKQEVADPPNDRVTGTVRIGDTLRVLEGRLRLVFDHGTEVDLQAPALYEVGSAMRTRLLRGRVTVTVAEGAEGFTIDTPRSSVVDLGTEFGLEVDELGCTDVVVFEGMVDVSFARDLGLLSGAELGIERLYGGGAMHINERGTASRINFLNSDRFVRRGESAHTATRPPLIASVSDNIKRHETWDFYEIVPEGMREDAKAYVDRQHHEWNGVDASGIPKYLLGGDYVKTFNNDRFIDGIKVSLELTSPAQVFVLWCDRTPLPDWLVSNFENTGDFLGVDEGDYIFPKGETVQRGDPGVGAGQSIDALHTIWKRVIDRPGVVELGAAVPTTPRANMYGIVATPLPAEIN